MAILYWGAHFWIVIPDGLSTMTALEPNESFWIVPGTVQP